MMEILPEIGQHAQQVNNRLLIEPLNKGETFYINRLEQALAFCQKTDSPGVCLMGDFYHMSKEEKDQERAFVEAGKWLHHVHLATGRSRILPGQEPHSYVEGFRGLQRLGYQDYCSLECGIKPTKSTSNDRGQVKLIADPEVEIPKAFAFLKAQWEQAGKVASSQ
jgi:sugar phosphate isomerase/epimerase